MRRRRFIRTYSSLALLAWPLMAAGSAAEPPQARVRLQLILQGPAVAPLHGEVTLRQKGADSSRVAALDGSSSVISLPSNSSWQLSTSIPGYWCRQETVQLGAPESETLQQILAWPLGTISGSAPTLASSLRGIDVETMAPRSAAARAAGLKGALRCPVDSSGKWSCTLPASVFDLKLSVHGFAPEYRLDVNVPPGTSLDLGPLALRPGASVAGWVQVAGGESLAPQCLVKLTPTDEATTNLPLTGTVRTQGFFQLTGVAPGRYVLEVDQPGFRSPKVPLDVSPGSATYLRGALLLSREPG